MNPLLNGISLGVLLSVLSFWLLWRSLGKGINQVFAWFVVAFLGKLIIVVTAILLVHTFSEGAATRPFAISLTLTVLPLLFLQLAACLRKLNALDKEGRLGDPAGISQSEEA